MARTGREPELRALLRRVTTITGGSSVDLLAAFEKLRPADLARVLGDLSAERRNVVTRALDDETLANAIEEMCEDDQIELLGGLEGDRAADVLQTMVPADVVRLLGELPLTEQQRLLTLLEANEATTSPSRNWRDYFVTDEGSELSGLVTGLIGRSVSSLPGELQERWGEEWAGDAMEHRSRILRLTWALGIRLVSAPRIRRAGRLGATQPADG